MVEPTRGPFGAPCCEAEFGSGEDLGLHAAKITGQLRQSGQASFL
jgi:hypothetical protein